MQVCLKFGEIPTDRVENSGLGRCFKKDVDSNDVTTGLTALARDFQA